VYVPAEYWPARYARQGESYVAKGGKPESSAEQIAALRPFLRQAIAGSRVLDFGCGPGRFRGVLEEGGREYVGVDLIPGLGTQPLLRELPRGFDTAVALFVLQHITDEAEYRHWVRELYECLNPGGRLVIVDHLADGEFEPHMRPRGNAPIWRLAKWSHQAVSISALEDHWCGVIGK
jgi:cyclopropane fatty-acyl-phospholipid synthase-like methyltransferase